MIYLKRKSMKKYVVVYKRKKYIKNKSEHFHYQIAFYNNFTARNLAYKYITANSENTYNRT